MKKGRGTSGRDSRPSRRQRSSEPDAVEFDGFTSGRILAWYAVQQYDETGQFLTDILSDADSYHALSSQERGLAVDVASGVIRRRRTLDTIIESQISRPRSNVEPELWRLLQLGAYQVLFSRAPDHAAVDTTVELARQVDRSRWCGFANGILRNVARQLTDAVTSQPAADALPIENGEYRKLSGEIFPNPATALMDYVGTAFSLPRAIARRWTERLSHFDLMKAGFHSMAVPQTVLRINRLAATVGHVQTALMEHGIDVTPGHNHWALKIAHASRIMSLPGYDQGWWSVQDESAMLASELLAPQPGERILDLCSAPGGKTTHLAEISGDRATIVACDVSEFRLQRVMESVERLKLSSVEPILIQRDGSGIPSGQYDAVLVDVPCSNTGVFSRRPEARWRFVESDLEELVQLQRRLLLTAFEQLRSGGRIVYSTCSIESEETTQLVNSVTERVPGLIVKEQALQLPGQPGDGTFRALLTKE